MCPRYSYYCSGRRGFSLVEVIISLALLILLSLITIQGMMMHARMVKANITQQQVAEGSRRFVDAIQVSALDATIMRIETGPAGPATVLTLGRPDPGNAGGILYEQYAYLDPDGNPDTIGDNILVVRNSNQPMATSGKPLIQLCSPVQGKAIFSKVDNAARPLINIDLQVGDRTSPPSASDNAETGNGYQGFRIAASISQL